MERIGLFGGSFDPIHFGHLLVAQAAREELKLTRLCLIPTAQSPFKPNGATISASQRVCLMRLALAGKPWCEIDEQEIQRGGVSYTIDTLRDYAFRFPNAQLFCLIGSDNLSQLGKWREASEIARLAEFVVIPRPGGMEPPFPKPFYGQRLNGFPTTISSTEIRKRVKSGLPIDHLVPPAVAENIGNNRLYL